MPAQGELSIRALSTVDIAALMPIKIDCEELAWAAGFFDGEGCVYQGTKRQLTMAISQTHPEPLERFRKALRRGKIFGPYVNKRGGRPYWRYSLSGFQSVQAAIAMLWKYLCTPKRQQSITALNNAAARFPLGLTSRQRQLQDTGKKTCSRCKQELPASSFYPNRKERTDGLQGNCKACNYDIGKEWYRKKKSYVS